MAEDEARAVCEVALIADTQTAGRRGRLILPATLVFFLGVLWLSIFDPITGFSPGTDSGVYLYTGQQMLKGAAPYRDVFDNKGLLLYVVNVLGLGLSGGSLWGVYVLEYLMLGVGVVFGFAALRPRLGGAPAFASMLFLVILLGRNLGGGNHEEEYVIPLCMVTLWLLYRHPRGQASLVAYAGAGVCAAAAFFFKPVCVGLWMAVIVAEALTAGRCREWRRFGRRMLVAASGALALAAAVLAYLLAVAALPRFVDAYFVFNLAYSSAASIGMRLRSVVMGGGHVGYVTAAAAFLLWMLVLVQVVRRRRVDAGREDLLLLAVLWLPVEVALASVSGYDRPQYYLMCVAPMSLLLGLAVTLAFSARKAVGGTSMPNDRRVVLGAAAIVAIVVAAVVGQAPMLVQRAHDLGGATVHYARWSQFRRDEPFAQAAAYIQRVTAPDDYVLVWGGYSADINFLARRTSPTRYAMQLALYSPRYGSRRVREFLDELRARPPALIIDTSPSFGAEWGRAVPPLSATSNPWAAAPPDFRTAWSDVFAYLQTEYVQETTLACAPHWIIYRPRVVP